MYEGRAECGRGQFRCAHGGSVACGRCRVVRDHSRIEQQAVLMVAAGRPDRAGSDPDGPPPQAGSTTNSILCASEDAVGGSPCSDGGWWTPACRTASLPASGSRPSRRRAGPHRGTGSSAVPRNAPVPTPCRPFSTPWPPGVNARATSPRRQAPAPGARPLFEIAVLGCQTDEARALLPWEAGRGRCSGPSRTGSGIRPPDVVQSDEVSTGATAGPTVEQEQASTTDKDSAPDLVDAAGLTTEPEGGDDEG